MTKRGRPIKPEPVPAPTWDKEYYRERFRTFDDKELNAQIEWIEGAIDDLQKLIDRQIRSLDHHPNNAKYVHRNGEELEERKTYQQLLLEEAAQRAADSEDRHEL